MILTDKDREFLETLKRLMASRELWVDLKSGRPSYMVLRGTYGEHVHRAFRMSRQGVRWRFQRLLNVVYVGAFESIVMVEATFGSQLRDHAMRISRERYALRREVLFEAADKLDRSQKSTIESESEAP